MKLFLVTVAMNRFLVFGGWGILPKYGPSTFLSKRLPNQIWNTPPPNPLLLYSVAFLKILCWCRVMMGAFPLIIPNDPIMKMKIEEKALSIMRRQRDDFSTWIIKEKNVTAAKLIMNLIDCWEGSLRRASSARCLLNLLDGLKGSSSYDSSNLTSWGAVLAVLGVKTSRID